MKEKGTALCPTLSVGRANADKKKIGVQTIARMPASSIASGSDVGVFAHGDNAREIETMVAGACRLLMRCAPRTSVDARGFTWRTRLDGCEPDFFADLIAVDGDSNARRLSPASREIRNENGSTLQALTLVKLGRCRHAQS